MFLPRISSDRYPKIRSALAFQLVIVPSSAFETIASFEASTTAPDRRAATQGLPPSQQGLPPSQYRLEGANEQSKVASSYHATTVKHLLVIEDARSPTLERARSPANRQRGAPPAFDSAFLRGRLRLAREASPPKESQHDEDDQHDDENGPQHFDSSEDGTCESEGDAQCPLAKTKRARVARDYPPDGPPGLHALDEDSQVRTVVA